MYICMYINVHNINIIKIIFLILLYPHNYFNNNSNLNYFVNISYQIIKKINKNTSDTMTHLSLQTTIFKQECKVTINYCI